jgi:hypothetical protein
VSRAVAVVAALILAGCSEGTGGPDPSPSAGEVSQAVADDAVLGVCDAIAALPADPDGAEAAFLDRAHQPIHLVAGALQGVDPGTAGRLLVAKQAVEADLALGPPALDHLETLLEAGRAAVEALGLVAPDCPA